MSWAGSQRGACRLWRSGEASRSLQVRVELCWPGGALAAAVLFIFIFLCGSTVRINTE